MIADYVDDVRDAGPRAKATCWRWLTSRIRNDLHAARTSDAVTDIPVCHGDWLTTPNAPADRRGRSAVEDQCSATMI